MDALSLGFCFYCLGISDLPFSLNNSSILADVPFLLHIDIRYVPCVQEPHPPYGKSNRF